MPIWLLLCESLFWGETCQKINEFLTENYSSSSKCATVIKKKMFVILHHNFLVLCIFGSYCKKTTRLRQIEERFGLQLLKRKCVCTASQFPGAYFWKQRKNLAFWDWIICKGNLAFWDWIICKGRSVNNDEKRPNFFGIFLHQLLLQQSVAAGWW